jgi:hypothetical protein
MQILSDSDEKLSDARSKVRAWWCHAFQVPALGKADDAWTSLELAFAGDHPNFEAIDAPYHDLDHTLRATTCYAELVVKNLQTPDYGSLPLEIAELGFIAILFHDTGYLKNKGDLNGTGAKYAFKHVNRSKVFANEWMLQNGFNQQARTEVQSMIQTTDFSTHTSPIPFASSAHQLAGCMVGTADLLGQMASPDYISKLPLLHQEMMEALKHDHSKGVPIEIPQSPQDLLRLTPSFFSDYVIPKLQNDYQNVLRLLNTPYPDGPNPYMEQIQRHLKSVSQGSK